MIIFLLLYENQQDCKSFHSEALETSFALCIYTLAMIPSKYFISIIIF